jgi:hypothetical protein
MDTMFKYFDTTTLPVKGNSTTKSMNDIYITENGVIKLLKDLSPHKASGPDQIPTRLLKLCASELAPAVVRVLVMYMSFILFVVLLPLTGRVVVFSFV